MTVNINLGKSFTGGDLFFDGIKEGVPHKLGYAIMHSGAIPHESTPLTSGERFNLILWYKCTYSFPLFSQFHSDLITTIAGLLSPRDLVTFGRCSKQLHEISKKPDVWHRVMRNHFPLRYQSILDYEKFLTKPSSKYKFYVFVMKFEDFETGNKLWFSVKLKEKHALPTKS